MKHVVLTIICGLLAAPVFAQETKLSGVITFFFNRNYGDKPDIGAKVFALLKDSITAEANAKTIDTFLTVSTLRAIQRNNAILKKELPESIKESIRKYGITTDEQFEALDERATGATLGIMMLRDDLPKTVVDGAGNYSLTLRPGEYRVFIKSNNRNSDDSMTEIKGKIMTKKVTVKKGETTNLSYNFEL